MKNEQDSKPLTIPPLPPAAGSAEMLELPNDTKIRFCNALDALRGHAAEGTSGECAACSIYMRHGDGDLCEQGKAIITKEMCYADTSLELPPNAPHEPRGTETSNNQKPQR